MFYIIIVIFLGNYYLSSIPVHVCRLTATCTREQLVESKDWTSNAKDQSGTKQGPSKDAQEKRENFDLSVGLTVIMGSR